MDKVQQHDPSALANEVRARQYDPEKTVQKPFWFGVGVLLLAWALSRFLHDQTPMTLALLGGAFVLASTRVYPVLHRKQFRMAVLLMVAAVGSAPILGRMRHANHIFPWWS